MRFVELAAERLCAAVPADHPLAGRKCTASSRLRREPFVSAVHRERGGLARVVIDLCLKRGFVPATARIVSPKTSMLNLVAPGTASRSCRNGWRVSVSTGSSSCRFPMKTHGRVARRCCRSSRRCGGRVRAGGRGTQAGRRLTGTPRAILQDKKTAPR
ncbi:LysR substrate-binding domain-containing protein [Burkholderia paludis]|uniref:LysR substrate-binding domain-containing protein n=1 Tax=Burkholderia paludis TaxID=1506587 RepID=UPI000B2C4270|nr:LysR substrate-binding domain-containing protein [Burkholderia paludis]